MKRNNKKTLYEKIMRNVSKQVKNALNEDQKEAMMRERKEAAKKLIAIIKASDFEFEYPEMLNRNEFLPIADMVSRYFMQEYGIPEEEIDKEQYIMALKMTITNFRQAPINMKKFAQLPTPDNMEEKLFKTVVNNMANEKIPAGQAAMTIIKTAQGLKVTPEKITDFVIHFSQWVYMNIAD